MFTFIVRRFSASAVVLLAATFIFFMLVAYAVDPLEELRTSSQINKAELIEARTRLLNLDTPPVARYFLWLKGVLGFLWGAGDLGASWRTNRETTDLLASAVGVTLRLVLVAALLAIVLGVVVGIASALRQYTGFDYSITFLSFLLYSLPTFWVAVLLKQWGAIGFNDFLGDPVVALPAILVLAVVTGLLWSAVVGGPRQRRLVTFGVAALATGVTLWFMSATQWMLDPSLGPVLIGVTGVGIAFAMTALLAGLRNRRALYAALSVVVLGVALWYPLQFAFVYATTWLILGLLAAAIGAAFLIGWAFGGPDRWLSVRVASLTTVFVALLVFIDRVMRVWKAYSESSFIDGRPIATIGSATPGLNGDFWVETLDAYTHLLLPTTALLLISFAGYTRYSRGSLLEVLNQDYIRTARAKGLPERVVVVRHAFRNALIPLATIIPLDIAAIFGGAVITERIFGWTGMGNLFITSLIGSDPNPIMGFFLVTGTLAVLANLVADLVYAGLDPRIRVNA